MISVIVPVYNVEPYLRECVDSILSQSYGDFELILVDDGSPDRCGEICDEYATRDPRVRVLHQENGGLSAARNAGLDIARGEYVTFIDSDDCVTSFYLEFLFRILQESDADVSVCREKCFSTSMTPSDAMPTSEVKVLASKQACIQPYLQYGLISITAWGKLYVRSLWDQVRFPVGKIHEDQATLPIVLYKAGKVAVSQEKLYCYRIVENSIMHKSFSLKRFDDIEAVDACIAFFENNNANDIAMLAREHRERLLAVYSISARQSGIYNQLSKDYRMSEWRALQILRNVMPDDKYTYYLAMVHPNWLRPHAYWRKIKKILHIPCN